MAFRDSVVGFFRGVGRVFQFLRVAFANVVVALVVLVLVAALLSGPGTVDVPDGSALVLAPKGTIVEQTTTPDAIASLMGSDSDSETRLGDILEALTEAKDDERIQMVVLDANEITAVSAAQLEVIGSALDDFKQTGKSVIASGNFYSQAQYYLASFADEVYMHPMGQLLFTGYGAYQGYFQELLETLKVNVHVFRVGTYKAAVEPFTRRDMSPEAKTANQQLVDAMWQNYADDVVANRGVDPAALERYVNHFDEIVAEFDGDMARAALEHGFVDELISAQELEARLTERLGAGDDDRFLRIGFADYLKAVRRPRLPGTQPKVGVIVARGTIMAGDQPRGRIGSETLAKLIREAREDDTVKALVLRVDSPGGSAFASEVIRHELELTQMAGKPLVVSMGGVAASGGYWISATADEIWAAPTTVTGSIGVFGLLPTFENSLSEVGVHRDGVGTSTLSGSLDALGGINQQMSNILQSSVENTYTRFINLVARGRDMAPAEVDDVAQGRVWAGSTAQQLGLVDRLGHLQDAIDSAAIRAELEDYEVKIFEKALTPREQLLAQLSDSLGLSARGGSPPSRAGQWLTQLSGGLDWLRQLNDPRDVYAICGACAQLTP